MNTATKKIFSWIALIGIFTFSFNNADAANVPKIKNIRIRQTGDTSSPSYKIIVIVKNDDADDVSNVQKIKKIIIRQTGDTSSPSYKIIVIVKNDDADDVSNIEVEIGADDSSSPVPTSTKLRLKENTLLSTETEKYFFSDQLSFKESPIGYDYTSTAIMRDANGKQIGQSKTETITITEKTERCPSDFDVTDITFSSTSAGIAINGGDLVITDNVEINISLAIGTNNNTYLLGAVIGFNNTKKDEEVTLSLNQKTGMYEGTIKLSGSEKSELEIDECILELENACNTYKYYLVNFKNCTGFGNAATRFDLRKFNPNKASNEEENTSNCKTSYKLKTVSTTTSNTSGLYTMAFQFAFEKGSDTPEKVEMVVQVKDCNGNTKNIMIDLKYDASTGVYTGGQAIKQSSTCAWSIEAAEIGAYNKCEELSAWELNISQYKANGVGTRNLATTNTTKPGLL